MARTAEKWAKRMTASFASAMSSDEDESPQRPPVPAVDAEPDDDGVEQAFERARDVGQIKPRSHDGQRAENADARDSKDFEAEKQKLLASLTEAEGDLSLIESEDDLYRRLYMRERNHDERSLHNTGRLKGQTSPSMLAGGFTRSGGPSFHHVPPPPMDTASWRIRASSALTGRDYIAPRPQPLSEGERSIPFNVTNSQPVRSTLQQHFDGSPPAPFASPTSSGSGLLLDAGGQAIKDTKFAVENSFSSFLSTVDFIGDGLQSAAGAPSVAALGIQRMGPEASPPQIPSAYGRISPHAASELQGPEWQHLSLSAALSRRGGMQITPSELSRPGVDPLAAASMPNLENRLHIGLHDTNNTAWTHNTYDTDSSFKRDLQLPCFNPSSADMEPRHPHECASNKSTNETPPRMLHLPLARILVDKVGPAPGQLLRPRQIAVDGSGNIVVVDGGNHRVQTFTESGALVRTFGKFGKGPGEFDCPWGLALDAANGNIVVSDTNNHRIQIFSHLGKHLKAFGSHGSAKGQLCFPHGVAISSQGEIIVADTFNHRVCMFSGLSSSWEGGGKILKTFAGTTVMSPSENLPQYTAFSYPIGVAISRGGDAAISDWKSHRLLWLGLDGYPKPPIGSPGDAPAQFDGPAALAFDGNQNILVCDYGNQRLQVLKPNGAHAQTFSSLGLAGQSSAADTMLQLISPIGLAGTARGEILVADCEHSIICSLLP